MPLITNQPENINFLSPLGFRFRLDRAPNLNFFVTNVNLPSISLGSIPVPTPFKVLEIPSTKLNFGDFQLTFRVDENFESYLEIYNWLFDLGLPEDFDRYASLKNQPRGSTRTQVCDATLTVLNSSMMPNIEITFQDLFPVSLSDINFNVTDTDVNYVTATAEFKSKIFKVKKS